MKKLLAVLLPAFLLLTMGAANAADVKIGVIDLHEILQQSTEAKAINKKLEDQFKPRQEKIVAKQKDVKAEMDKYSKNSAVMNESQKSAAQEQIVKDRRDLDRMEQDYQQDLGVAQNQAMSEFLAKLKTVITQVAKKDGYDLILQKDGVPYANDSIDVTAQILKALA